MKGQIPYLGSSVLPQKGTPLQWQKGCWQNGERSDKTLLLNLAAADPVISKTSHSLPGLSLAHWQKRREWGRKSGKADKGQGFQTPAISPGLSAFPEVSQLPMISSSLKFWNWTTIVVSLPKISSFKSLLTLQLSALIHDSVSLCHFSPLKDSHIFPYRIKSKWSLSRKDSTIWPHLPFHLLLLYFSSLLFFSIYLQNIFWQSSMNKALWRHALNKCITMYIFINLTNTFEHWYIKYCATN